jgi:predicted outer membrane repeat protein
MMFAKLRARFKEPLNTTGLPLVLLALGLLVIGLLWVGWHAAPVYADTINVDDDTGVDGPSCGPAPEPCRTIPYAVDYRAVSGDVVSVWAGTYTETFSLKAGVIISGAGSAVTFIDGENVRGPMVIASGSAIDQSAGLRGFTIRRGVATNGGGIYIEDDAFPLVELSVLRENQAANNGGGIYVAGSLSLDQMQFISNTAGIDGGGLCQDTVDFSGRVDVTNSLFERNIASGTWADGGGLYVAGSAALTDTQVISNTARHRGGGLHQGAESGQLDLTRVLIQGNQVVLYDGGGISAWGDATLLDTDVISNTAREFGGGAYFQGNLTVNDGRIERNVVDCGGSVPCHGGAMYVFGNATLTDAVVTNNTAGEHAGGLYVGGDALVFGGRLEQNVATGGHGGGLYVLGDATLNDAQLTDNTAGVFGGGLWVQGSANLTGMQVADNTSIWGGGLYQPDGTETVNVTNSVFEQNRALTWRGGGMYVGGDATVSDTQVLTNTAATYGGGICVEGSVSLTGTDVISNTAGESGGGLFQDSGSESVHVSGSRFERNAANGTINWMDGGGAIFARGSVELVSTQLAENSAVSDGGGLYAERAVDAVNSFLLDNVADDSGSAIYLSGFAGEQSLRHLTIARPTLGGGSAVYVLSGTVTITDTIITLHSTGIRQADGTIREDYNLYYGNGTNFSSTGGTLFTGANSLYGQDPLFEDPVGGDYHLGYGSPAINAGIDVGVIEDFDGDLRPQLGGYDIGADEFPAGVRLAPNRSSTADPGTLVVYNHTLTNTGLDSDTFVLSHSSSQGWTVTYGAPGELGPGEEAAVVVNVTVPGGLLAGTVDTTVITATSQSDPDVFDTATDTTTVDQVAGVSLEPDRSDTGEPGTIVTYTHSLENTGNGTDTIDLSHVSSQGWTVTYDTPVVLDAGEETTVVVSVTVPAGTLSDTVDSTTLTATSQADPAVSDSATDTTTASRVVGVSLEPDRSDTGDPGTIVTYTHSLENTGNGTDTLDLSHVSSQGWTVTYDTLVVLDAGEETTVVVSVAVPAGTLSDTVDSTTLTATSQADPAVSDSATDTTTASRVVGVSLEPDRSDTGDPGTIVTYTHSLENTGNHADAFALSHVSSQGWTVTYDTPVVLDAGVETTIVVSVAVPAGAVSSTVDITTLTATSQADPGVSAAATDTTTVGQVTGVSLDPDRSDTGEPGTVVAYSHTLVNGGSSADTFDLSHTSSQGWTVTYDTSIALDPGEETTVVVNVTIPAGILSGTVDSTTVTATSQTNPAVTDSTTDTTTVSRVVGVSLEPDRSGTMLGDWTLAYDHTLINTGNSVDTFDLSHVSSQGWTVTYDTPVVLGPGQQTTVVVSITAPAGTPIVTMDSTTVTAISRADPGISAAATDTTTVGRVVAVDLEPDRSSSTEWGRTVTYTHSLVNNGSDVDSFQLSHISSQGWAVSYETPISLDPGEETMVMVSVTVPVGIVSGTVDSTVITARSLTDSRMSAVVTDMTTVWVRYRLFLPFVYSH